MMKPSIALAACLVAVSAFAASVHLKPPNRNPTFVDNGLFLQVVGSLAGLGNGDVVISLAAQGNVTATCTNQGGNAAPGQNPAPISVSGSVAIPEEDIKNGTLRFDVRTLAPDPVIAGAPDCANTNWTERITDISFTSFVLTVEQPAGVVVMRLSCTAAAPTTNGSVSPSLVTCT